MQMRVMVTLLLTLARSATADPSAEADGRLTAWLEDNLTELVATYEQLHANPELSLEEVKTAARVADALGAAGYEIISGIGGHGVAGILRNGPGPTVLIRGDMDALPVREETGLPYSHLSRIAACSVGENYLQHT